MTDTRAPRPTDLVALVTFDDEVRENQAVTRDHLRAGSAESEVPAPLASALGQWLHLGRRMWISLAGREIRGIATARELTSKSAWEFDTLIDAPEADEQVVVDLLRQAALAAREELATHLILRTPTGSPAAEHAPRAGFRPVVEERLWRGHIERVNGEAAAHVREAEGRDTIARFQVYSRTLPVTAREAIAMTVEEWEAVQDFRWVERGATFVAEVGGRVVASARSSRNGQFTLATEGEAPGAGDALLQAIAHHQPRDAEPFALLPSGAPAEDVLRRAGFTPSAEYALFCLRISHPVRDEAYARAGVAITG